MNIEHELLIATLLIVVLLLAVTLMLKQSRVKERTMSTFNVQQSPEELLQNSRWYYKPNTLFVVSLLFLPAGLYGLYKQHMANKRRRMFLL